MQKNRWIVASMFAWCLSGAVALAVYSGPPPIAAQAATLVPEETSENGVASEKMLAQSGSDAKKAPAKKPSKANPKLKAIRWEPTFEAAMKRAKAQNKPVMIDFYTDWCHWCKELDRVVYTDKAVIAESAHWISVKVDAEKRTDISRSYGVSGFPTVMFVDSKGKPVHAVPGYQEAPDFLLSMRTALAKWTPETV